MKIPTSIENVSENAGCVFVYPLSLADCTKKIRIKFRKCYFSGIPFLKNRQIFITSCRLVGNMQHLMLIS